MKEYLFPLEQLLLDYPLRRALKAYGIRFVTFALCTTISLTIVAGVGFLAVVTPAAVISTGVIAVIFAVGHILRRELVKATLLSIATEQSTYSEEIIHYDDIERIKEIEARIESGEESVHSEETIHAIELDDDIERIKEIEARIESGEESVTPWPRAHGVYQVATTPPKR